MRHIEEAFYALDELISEVESFDVYRDANIGKNKKSIAISDAAFVYWDQVLGGGCNWEIADMREYHNF